MDPGINICMYMYACLPKYKTFSQKMSFTYRLSGVTIWRWTNNWCVCCSLEKTVPSTPSIPQLLTILLVGLRPCKFSPFYFAMTIIPSLDFIMPWLSCWWASGSVASDITRKHNITVNFLILTIFHHFFNVPWSLGVGRVWRYRWYCNLQLCFDWCSLP